MLDPAAALRLMLGLAGMVYLGISAVEEWLAEGSARLVRRLIVVLIGVIPLLAWMVRPELFRPGGFLLPFLLRRASLFAAGAALLLRYVVSRSAAKAAESPDRPRVPRTPMFVSHAVVLAAIACGSANWMVTAPFGVAVASLFVTLVAELRREPSSQLPSRQEGQ